MRPRGLQTGRRASQRTQRRSAVPLLALVALASACGRLGFEPLGFQGDDGGAPAGDDGGDADPGDAGGAACPAAAAPGVRAYLPFDEGAGTTAGDRSSYGNHGQLAGPMWTDGRDGGAIDLDGTGDEVNLGSAASVDDLTPLTVCAWILPRSYPNQFPAIADKSSDTFTGGWNFYIEDNGTFGLLAHNRKWATGGDVSLGAWQHLCASWDGSAGVDGIRLYQNGVAVAITDNGSNGNRSDSDAEHDLVIGRVNNETFPFDGLIDEFVLYEGVLDAAQVSALFECASS